MSHQLKILLACFNSEPNVFRLYRVRQVYTESFFTTYNPKKVAKNHVKVSCSSLYAQYSWYTQKQSVLQI